MVATPDSDSNLMTFRVFVNCGNCVRRSHDWVWLISIWWEKLRQISAFASQRIVTLGARRLFVYGLFHPRYFENGPLKPGYGLCHTAAILPREAEVPLFYRSTLAPKFFTARSRVVKQSFFQSLGTIWLPCVNKALIENQSNQQTHWSPQ